MKSFRFVGIVILALLASTASTQAGLINLTYSGVDDDDSLITSVGSGNFAFTSSATTLSLTDLTAFSFSQRTTSVDRNLLGAATFSYGLSDLISFSATISSTGAVTALRFTTGYTNPTNSTFSAANSLAPQYVVVTSLRNGGLVTYNNPSNDLQHGTIIATNAVPEPSSLALGCSGISFILMSRHRRFTARKERRQALNSGLPQIQKGCQIERQTRVVT